MWDLITHCYPPPNGPRIETVRQHPGTKRWNIVQVAGTRVGRPRRAAAGVKWTWGAFLLDTMLSDGHTQRLFHDTDVDLRELVMRCMMDDPADRPGMQELERIFEQKLRGRWRGVESDGQLRGDAQTTSLFVGPAPHRVRPQAELDAVSLPSCCCEKGVFADKVMVVDESTTRHKYPPVNTLGKVPR
jgi:hypothetical protein